MSKWFKQIWDWGKKIVALEKRVTELERKLEGPWPPDVCKTCGERALRMESSRVFSDAGRSVRQVWVCGKCQSEESRLVTAAKN